MLAQEPSPIHSLAKAGLMLYMYWTITRNSLADATHQLVLPIVPIVGQVMLTRLVITGSVASF